MTENYYCDITKFYIKAFLFTSIVIGIPIIVLLLNYRNVVNNCIIKELKNNITSVEAVKKCDDVGILFILFLFIQLSVIGISGTMVDNKDFNKPIKPDNSNLEIETNL